MTALLFLVAGSICYMVSKETVEAVYSSYSTLQKVDEYIEQLRFQIIRIFVSCFFIMTAIFFIYYRQQKIVLQMQEDLEKTEKDFYQVKGILDTKLEVEKAYQELSSYMHGINEYVMITVTDEEGRIIDVNEKFCEITGYLREELVGWKHTILSSGVHLPVFFDDMWTTISGGNIWRDEICNKTKAGEFCWMDTSIIPIRDDEGKICKYISIRLDITARKWAEDNIAQVGLHDPLTGLANRILLIDRIQRSVKHHERYKGYFSILQIDIANFKHINETYGYDTGDKLLIEIGRRLEGLVRAGDTVARQGGDKYFVFLSTITNSDHAEIVAMNLLKKIKEPFVIDEHEITLSAYIGIVVYPENGENAEVLLKHSDISIYRAKELTKNTKEGDIIPISRIV